jgi:hypothetical protein
LPGENHLILPIRVDRLLALDRVDAGAAADGQGACPGAYGRGARRIRRDAVSPV